MIEVGNTDLMAHFKVSFPLRQHEASKMAVTLTAVQPVGRFGVLELDEQKNCVLGFREKAKEDNHWINAGFMVMNPEVFQYLDGDDCILERRPLEQLSASGQLGVYRHDGFWQCMDTQRDKSLLDYLWETGKAEWRVWNT